MVSKQIKGNQKSNWKWPFAKIESKHEAIDSLKAVSKAWYVIAAIKLILYSYFFFTKTAILGLLLDTTIYALAAFFLPRIKSRSLAVFMLLFSLADAIEVSTGGGDFLFFAFILIVIAYKGVQAAFAYHKLIFVSQPKNENQKPEWKLFIAKIENKHEAIIVMKTVGIFWYMIAAIKLFILLHLFLTKSAKGHALSVLLMEVAIYSLAGFFVPRRKSRSLAVFILLYSLSYTVAASGIISTIIVSIIIATISYEKESIGILKPFSPQ